MTPPADDPFFDCQFVWTPRELAGDGPYILFVDEGSDPFMERLILTCRGEAGFRGAVSDAAEIPPDAEVFCEGPVWVRQHEGLAAAGVRGPRVGVLLYFDVDPSGFWDFAQACGDRLGEVFRGGVDTDNLEALGPFLEHWSGSRVHNGRILPYARFYTRDFYPLHRAHSETIVRVMAALADDESRAAYSRILFGTAEQVFSSFSRSVFDDQQYMAIVHPRPGDVIVNCGVGRGWELPYFLARLKGRGAIHNIDPNIVYFSSCFADFVYRFPDLVHDHPIVAGDQDGRIALEEIDSGMVGLAPGESGKASRNGGGKEYEIRKLDSLMADGMADRIDYLKMDVEGGEKAILAGAVETIRKHRPKLAVAIYHDPEHLWDYPAFILDHFEDYRLYVRQYGYSRFETLLYAVPAEAAAERSGAEGVPAPPGADRPDAPPEDARLLIYMHDAPGAAREYYKKPVRALTRMAGADWRAAPIDPGPYVEAEEVFGVLEADSGSIVLTRHRGGEGVMRAAVGVSPVCTEIEWAYAAEIADDASCLFVDSDDRGVRFIVYDPSEKTARLFQLNGPRLVRRQSVSLESAPVYARWAGGTLRMLCTTDGAALQEVVIGPGGAASRAPAELPPGRFAGFLPVAPQRSAVRESGLAMLDDAETELTVYARSEGGFTPVARVDWTPKLRVVSTLTRPGAIVAIRRSLWRRAVLAAATRLGLREAVMKLAARGRRMTGRTWR